MSFNTRGLRGVRLYDPVSLKVFCKADARTQNVHRPVQNDGRSSGSKGSRASQLAGGELKTYGLKGVRVYLNPKSM